MKKKVGEEDMKVVFQVLEISQLKLRWGEVKFRIKSLLRLTVKMTMDLLKKGWIDFLGQ